MWHRLQQWIIYVRQEFVWWLSDLVFCLGQYLPKHGEYITSSIIPNRILNW